MMGGAMTVCFVFSSFILIYLGEASAICEHFQEVPRKSPGYPVSADTTSPLQALRHPHFPTSGGAKITACADANAHYLPYALPWLSTSNGIRRLVIGFINTKFE